MIEMPVRPEDNNANVLSPHLSPKLLGILTDYKTLCAPYVPDVRDVLSGRQYRFKVNFHDTAFHFYHGCLMVQVLHDGLLRALPHFGKTDDGKPYMQTLPEPELHWFDDFLTLPKSVLLFYFTLMKDVFKSEPLRFRWEDPKSGEVSWVEPPVALRSILQETEWATAA